MLKFSFTTERKNRAWCEETRRQTPLRQLKEAKVLPEHLVINKTPNQEIFTKKSVRKGKIMVIEKLGSNLFFYIENKDEPIVVASPESTTNMQIGDIVNVGFDPHKLYVFDINKNSI